MKWKKDYIANRIEFNDEFIEESIERTVAAIGFNSKVRSGICIMQIVSSMVPILIT